MKSFIKLFITSLTVFQFASSPAFWYGNFVSLLSTIIFFHIAWFFVESTSKQTVVILTASILLMISSISLHQLPVFLYILLYNELAAIYFKRYKPTVIFIITIGLAISLWLNPNLDSSALSRLSVLAMSLSTGLSLANFEKEITKLKESQYLAFETQKEIELTQESLENQLDSQKEIYILQERNRISREIHDSVGHVLTTNLIQLEALSKLTENKIPQVSEMLKELRAFTRKGLNEVRKTVYELKPDHYEQVTLIESLTYLLENFENQSSIKIYFSYNQARWLLNEKQQTTIYNTVKECLSNAIKHGQASTIRIHLYYTDNSLILTLKDNGSGQEKLSYGFGLNNIVERVKLLQGKINFKTQVNKGFQVRLVLYREDEITNDYANPNTLS